MKEYNNCFLCGKDNPIGLKLDFDYLTEDGLQTAVCKFKLNKNYEGYPGIIHGGIVAAVLDEAMAKACIKFEQEAFTVKMTTEYKQNIKVDTEYLVKAGIVKQKRRLIFCKAGITDTNNKICATAEATYFKIT